MLRIQRRKPRARNACPHYGKITSSQSGVGREFPPPVDPAPIPARHKKVWNRMGNTPRDVRMDGSSRLVLCRISPVEMTDNRPSLENLPGDSRLDHHTSHEGLISAGRRQIRDVLGIRKADRRVGRRLRDLSLRPVLTHDPAPPMRPKEGEHLKRALT